MTRAGISLINLNFKDVISYNPLIYLVILVGFILIFKSHKIINTFYSNKFFWVILLVIFIGFYIIRMYLYFPNYIPMDFNNKALIPKLIKFLQEIK